MIIAQTGTHGTGKTTAAANMLERMKKQFPDKSVHPAVDQEALCPYAINSSTSAASQLWIFTRIINKELALLSRFDLVVTDRTVVDAIAYTHAAGFQSLATNMLFLASDHMHRYRKIVFRQAETNQWCSRDGIRAAGNDPFRIRVEAVMRQMYENLIHRDALRPEVITYV